MTELQQLRKAVHLLLFAVDDMHTVMWNQYPLELRFNESNQQIREALSILVDLKILSEDSSEGGDKDGQ